MTENSDDDSEIEDFCLDYLFEEIVDLPEVLIDEQLNNSSDQELESILSYQVIHLMRVSLCPNMMTTFCSSILMKILEISGFILFYFL